MIDLESWLAARDHVAMRRTWEALPVVLRPVGTAHRKLTLHGAAQLAGAMLGERADWLGERSHGAPSFNETRISEGSFLDHVWSVTEANQEALSIHERGGVQLITISSGTITGRPEGGGVTAVRIFDGARAAVVPIDVYSFTDVATIGDVDLAPLDLLDYANYFTFAGGQDVETARAVVAQLLADVDAYYDTSTQWPEGPPAMPADWYPDTITSHQTFTDGTRSVTVGHQSAGGIRAGVTGLPWGQHLTIHLDGANPYLRMRFPTADLDRVEARLASLGKR